MTKYANEQLCAYNGIKDAGFAISFKYTTGGSGYDGVTETYAVDPTTVTVNTYAVLTKVNPEYIDGTVVVNTDQTMLIPSLNLTVEITQGMTITSDSKTWQVILPESVSPDNEPIIYKVIVRGNR